MAKFYTQEQVAAVLKAALDKHNITQADLARKLKVSPQLVSLSVSGLSLSPKVAKWLGFQRHAGAIYERTEERKAKS